MSLLVTGGAGFIGSHFVRDWLAENDEPIITLDKLTYAGNLRNLIRVRDDARHVFVHGDIGDTALVPRLLEQHQPRAIIHCAAESHVDRSLHQPSAFIDTNIVGSFHLLEAARAYWKALDSKAQSAFRFLHVSTDEVYGALTADAPAFQETHPYAPNNPYAASKAASDHLVRAYHHSYGLPVLTTHSCNNYGPYQCAEKLIPFIICQALAKKPLPLYGDGQHIRDWLYVGDHCAALRRVLEAGHIGETYNIGSHTEKTNLEVVQVVCALLDELAPRMDGVPYATQISFVAERPGHDRRYAIDAAKIQHELGWKPTENFANGLRKTVQWHLSLKE